MGKLAIFALAVASLAPAAAMAAEPNPAVPTDQGRPAQTDPAKPHNAQEARDLKEINQLWDDVTDAFRKRDATAAMAGMLHSPDFVEFDLVMPFADPGYDRNLAKTQAWMQQSKGPTEVDYFDRHIVLLSPTSAYGTAFIHFVGTTLAGDKIDKTARHTRIIRKIDGKWVCVLEHSSVPEGWSVKI